MVGGKCRCAASRANIFRIGLRAGRARGCRAGRASPRLCHDRIRPSPPGTLPPACAERSRVASTGRRQSRVTGRVTECPGRSGTDRYAGSLTMRERPAQARFAIRSRPARTGRRQLLIPRCWVRDPGGPPRKCGSEALSHREPRPSKVRSARCRPTRWTAPDPGDA